MASEPVQTRVERAITVDFHFPAERRIESLIVHEQEAALRNIWTHFDNISRIPRLSGEEEGVRAYLRGFAQERADRGVEYHQDEAGNVAILIPATEGHEVATGVVLQGHMDMVCLPEGEEGPATNGVVQVIDPSGELLISATGSTSGADNGIGLASALALADSEAHGPLMIVATVDEEIGLGGALNIGFPELDLSAYPNMINLDSEKEGEITIGCAGGAGTDIILHLEREPIAEGKILVEVNVSGLLGGHSGLMIGKDRANALKVLAGALEGQQIVQIGGGQAENAIPSSARAIIALYPDELDALQDQVDDMQDYVKWYEGTKKNPTVALTTDNVTAQFSEALTQTSSDAVLRLLLDLPSGVERWTEYKEGLPETSTNLGLVETNDDEVKVRMLSRSFIDDERHKLEAKIAEIGEGFGAEVVQEPGYSAWQPDPNNELVAMVEEVYKELTGEDAELVAEHFGVECGVILARPQFNHLRAVSLGPVIHGAHEEGESVDIQSVRRFYEFLQETVKRIAG